MADKPNFVLVPDPDPEAPTPRPQHPTLFDRVRSLAQDHVRSLAQDHVRSLAQDRVRSLAQDHVRSLTQSVMARLPFGAPKAQVPATGPMRARLIFGFDATASREPAWATARGVTDALVKALPGELDVALAVHGGSRLHTFTEFTANANTLRDRAAGIRCIAGFTQLLPILSRALSNPGVRVVSYIGDVFEESQRRGQKLADAMGQQGIRLIVLHDVADWNARRDAEVFLDLARRTGGCVLPFDANAPARLRELLAAVAVYAVGGREMLEEKRAQMPGAVVLLDHLNRG